MLILGIAACGDMYDVHEKYLKMGEETYLGIASDLEANSGFNRIELKWKLNADPRINASIISWEGCETPIEVPISADRDVNDYISKIIDLSEGKYIFSIINKSETGKESLIQTISGEVYGEGNGIPFREEDSGCLNWTSLRACYPTAKRTAETLCISYASQCQIETLIIRPCHIYGPFFTPKDDRVYAQLIRNAVADEDILLKSTGLRQRSWCYVVDCVFALLYVLLKGETGNAYNIADVRSNTSICEFAEMVALKSGRKVVFDIPDNAVSNPPDISKTILSTDKINEIGWFPLWNLEEGISHTLNTFV